MVHLGDITKMSGYTIPPVDVVTFGSPCQDLSIAGKRAGMAGERSGLFSEAVRIIREMTHGGGLNGPAPGQFWQTTTRWRGELWMPSTGAFPNVACASRLSSILQVGVPEKYFLSRKACEGILRRASRRGKQLPELLKMALEQQIERSL